MCSLELLDQVLRVVDQHPVVGTTSWIEKERNLHRGSTPLTPYASALTASSARVASLECSLEGVPLRTDGVKVPARNGQTW